MTGIPRDPADDYPDTLENGLETDARFADETAQRSLGRLGWLLTRMMAEMTIILDSLEIGDQNRQAIMSALYEYRGEVYEFVEDGLGVDERDIEFGDGDVHPKQDLIEEILDEIEDKWALHPKDSSKTMLDGFGAVLDLGTNDSSDIIRLLLGILKKPEDQAITADRNDTPKQVVTVNLPID